MLTTKEAIEQRRSIRRFKSDPIPDEHVLALLDAARLAPSGCNSQPWRFKIVKDKETRLKLSQAAYNQSFIAEAPVVLVCCGDVKSYLERTTSGLQDFGRVAKVDDKNQKIVIEAAGNLEEVNIERLGPRIAFNLAIAIEHIVLRALDFGVGSCWVRLFDTKKIKEMFGWDVSLYIAALLPLGYPDESPNAIKRLKLEEIIID